MKNYVPRIVGMLAAWLGYSFFTGAVISATEEVSLLHGIGKANIITLGILIVLIAAISTFYMIVENEWPWEL